MIRRFLPPALCIFLSPSLVAPQVAPPEPGVGTEIVHIPIDMLVTFRLEERISSADTPVGARVHLTLANDISADGRVVAPAGTSCYVTITHSRPRNGYRNGELSFTDPTLDLGNRQQIRFAQEDSDDRKNDRELIALLLPPAVILSPVWATWLVIHKIRQACEPPPKLPPNNGRKGYDMAYSEGSRFDYYVRRAVTVSLDKVKLPTPASKSARAPDAP